MKHCFPLLLAVLLSAAPLRASSPNILFMMSDDLGWKDVGFNGSDIRTPNLDKLAAEGVRLDRYYAYPMCDPTRSALMTGRMPLRHVPDRDAGRGGGGRALPLSERTIAEIFKDAGYQTYILGKWHQGNSHVKYFPHNRGFDHFYGLTNAGVDHFTHVSRGALDWQRNGKSVREEGYSTHLLTDEAVRLLEGRDRSRPFFLYMAYNAAHGPLQVPRKYYDRYPDIEDETRRIYAGMVDCMDESVGRLLSTLEKEGVRSETLVVWVNDNGGARAGDNGILRQGKGTVFEGGIRVPGLVNWPGKVPSGKVLSQQISVHDWLPTLTTATGVEFKPEKPLDGQDMWAAIARGEEVKREDLIIAHGGSQAIFRGKWKFVQAGPRGAGESGGLLFDILADPGEQKDLAAMYPTEVAELAAVLAELPAGGGGRGGSRPGGRRGGGGGFRSALVTALDADQNGEISAEEIENAAAVLRGLDRDKNGELAGDELGFTGGRGGRRGPRGGPGGGRRGPGGGDFTRGAAEETGPPVAESAATD